MKILLCLHQFFPRFSTGTEVLAWNTARGLRDRGHEVQFLVADPVEDFDPAKPAQASRIEYDGFPVTQLEAPLSPSAWPDPLAADLANPDARAAMETILESFRPDLVHVFHFLRLSLGVLEPAQARGIPVVFSPTDFWSECPTVQLLCHDGSLCPGPNPGSGRCLRHLTQRALEGRPGVSQLTRIPNGLWSLAALGVDATRSLWGPRGQAVASLRRRPKKVRDCLNSLGAIFVPSRVVRTSLGRLGVREELFEDLPYGIDTPAKKEKVPSSTLRLGYIGTLSEPKGAHVLLEALAELDPDANWEAKIYGDRAQFPEYVQRLDALAQPVPRVQFRGTFPFETIAEVFAELDALVIPSIWNENTPLVAHSARAYGCPILGSRIGGLTEVVEDQVSGRLFAPGSALELSQILRGWVEDPSRLPALAAGIQAPRTLPEYMQELGKGYRRAQERGKPCVA